MTSEQEVFDEDAIEKYSKGVTRVENILNLHKLRQRVLLEEKLATVGRSDNSLKKYASTPNLFSGNRTVLISCYLFDRFFFRYHLCIIGSILFISYFFSHYSRVPNNRGRLDIFVFSQNLLIPSFIKFRFTLDSIHYWPFSNRYI